MTGMLASPGNRGKRGVDDPWDDDGFYAYRRFKAAGGTGRSGGRPWRRALRRREGREVARQIRDEVADA